MKILKLFTKWSNKTGVENKKKNDAYSNYTPSKDFYKSIREKELKEKERLKKWQRELKQTMNSNSYSSSIGHLPGSVTAKNTFTGSYTSASTITASNISNSAITINGDATNGHVKIDVPLLVNGRDVMKELDEMRDVLLLLKRDVDMEAKYPRLKELKDEYERALEKYQTFDAVKESK